MLVVTRTLSGKLRNLSGVGFSEWNWMACRSVMLKSIGSMIWIANLDEWCWVEKFDRDYSFSHISIAYLIHYYYNHVKHPCEALKMHFTNNQIHLYTVRLNLCKLVFITCWNNVLRLKFYEDAWFGQICLVQLLNITAFKSAFYFCAFTNKVHSVYIMLW